MVPTISPCCLPEQVRVPLAGRARVEVEPSCGRLPGPPGRAVFAYWGGNPQEKSRAKSREPFGSRGYVLCPCGFRASLHNFVLENLFVDNEIAGVGRTPWRSMANETVSGSFDSHFPFASSGSCSLRTTEGYCISQTETLPICGLAAFAVNILR